MLVRRSIFYIIIKIYLFPLLNENILIIFLFKMINSNFNQNNFFLKQGRFDHRSLAMASSHKEYLFHVS